MIPPCCNSQVAIGSPMRSGSDSREFFGGLESLRGIAAMGVAIFHIAWTFPFHDLLLIRNGSLMVDFFFVLSGFVIYHSYGGRIDTARDVAKFMWLRLGRLYPLHLTLLLVFLGIEIAKSIAEIEYGLVANKKAFTSNNAFSFASNLLLVQALGFHDKATYNLVAWSISTEFYTYALFAVASLFIKNRAVIVFALIILIATSIVFELGEFSHSFFRCIIGFFLGVLAYGGWEALNQAGVWLWTSRYFKDICGIASLAGILFLLSGEISAASRAFLLLLYAILIISTAGTGWLSKLLTAAPLARLGQLSYSIYMVHLAVIWLFSQALRFILHTPQIIDRQGDPLLTPHPLVGILFVCLTILAILLLSQLTYAHIEDPFRKKSKALIQGWLPSSINKPARRVVSSNQVEQPRILTS